MFWGLTLRPGEQYVHTLGQEVNISLATLECRPEFGADLTSYSYIMVKNKYGEQLLCTLVGGVVFQQTLNIRLTPNEEISFFVGGKNTIYLSGYSIDDSEYIPDNQEVDVYKTSCDSNGIQVNYEEQTPDFVESIKVEMKERGFQEDFPEADYHDSVIVETESDAGGPNQKPTDLEALASIADRTFPPRTSTNYTNASQTLYSNSGRRLNDSSYDENQTGIQEEGSVSSYGQTSQTCNVARDVSSASTQSTLQECPVSSYQQLPVTSNTSNATDISLESRQTTPQVLPVLYQSAKKPVRILPRVKARNNLPSSNVIQNHLKPVSKRRKRPESKAALDSFKCAFCNKQCSNAFAKRIHERIHTGERPYQCNRCPKSFATRSNLTQHEFVHNGIRPHRCKFCGKGFLRKDRLQNHMSKSHFVWKNS